MKKGDDRGREKGPKRDRYGRDDGRDESPETLLNKGLFLKKGTDGTKMSLSLFFLFTIAIPTLQNQECVYNDAC